MYKSLIGVRHLHICLDKKDRFDRVYNGIRYLALLGDEKYDFIYNRIKHLIGLKNDSTYVIYHNYAKIKVDSHNSLALEKTSTFHNMIILIKPVWNKDKNNYYYKILLEKGSYQSPKNNDKE